MNLRSIARALGGEVSNGQVLAPGPGHRSPKDRSMWTRLSPTAPDGILCGSFSGNGWQTCKDHIRQRLGLPAFHDKAATPVLSRERPPRPIAPDPHEIRNREAATRIWSSRDPRGTSVSTYLKIRRLALQAGTSGNVLRFHPECPWREGDRTIRVPAMIAALRTIETNEIVGIHRTRLINGGKKVDRRMLGTAAGAAIKIDADENVTMGLVIGEGIETCLAARKIGFKPIWALGSCGAIATFPVLPGIDAVTLLAENDEASLRAVNECAARWHTGSREVIIIDPLAGSDVNDAIRELA